MTRRVDAGPKWMGVTPDELEEGLICALAGELFAERCLIEYFYERMTVGLPYDDRILEHYLTEVFKQTLERTAGKEDVNLLLRRSRGRPESSNKTERDLGLAAAALLGLREGATWEDACNDAADRSLDSERKVQRALKDHREHLEKLTDAELDALLHNAEGDDSH